MVNCIPTEPREALAIHDTCRLQFPGYQEIAVVVE